ncbi:MAG TPA: TetR family transcriptional regulator C-terminal domain-containing protein [Gemmatimonadaceae bacterium]|nr:TetR family transcriptional regulator C-terminal domain-containing protein [Gemmatimonadaceae bacterium]
MPGRRAPEEERREAILRAAFAVAARERLGALTARAVAAEAGVSAGLVFFYFESVDKLLVELLDWLLVHTIVAADTPDRLSEVGDPGARMMIAIRRDVEWLPKQRERVELFFDYWVLGTRHPTIRRKIRRALNRYRDAFAPLARALVESDPDRYGGMSAEGLASVAAGFVEGCALQVVMDPAEFDVERSMTTLAALVRAPASSLA